MEEERTVLTFSLSPNQLKYRDVLSRDFLELDVYAISDINPNRNGTHFTLEGLKAGLKTFKNKPIVGFFEKGDFGEHDGRMDKDYELNQKYWNTEYGERILGFIRESDIVEIVPWKGLNWIHFTCVLCIRYCYKQAKKLLKDRTKKVSVEVITTKYEYDEKGIKHIYDFDLKGVTILGSKNGRPVLEAIPDAHASILEKLDEAVLEGQREVLCFAYKDYSNEAKNDIENNTINNKKEDCAVDDKQFSAENAETKCAAEEECKNSVPDQECNNSAEETNCNNSAEGGKAPEQECNNSADGTCTADPDAECNNSAEGEKCSDPAPEGEECATDAPEAAKCSDDDDEGEEGHEHGPDCTCPDCMAKKCEELQAKCDGYEAQIAELNEKLSACQDYADVKCRMEKAEAELHQIHCNELKMKACEMMKDEKLPEETCKAIEEKCSAGAYASQEEMERDVAFAIFKARPTNQHEEYSVNIVVPENNKTQKQPKSRKERMAQYAAGRK